MLEITVCLGPGQLNETMVPSVDTTHTTTEADPGYDEAPKCKDTIGHNSSRVGTSPAMDSLPLFMCRDHSRYLSAISLLHRPPSSSALAILITRVTAHLIILSKCSNVSGVQRVLSLHEMLLGEAASMNRASSLQILSECLQSLYVTPAAGSRPASPSVRLARLARLAGLMFRERAGAEPVTTLACLITSGSTAAEDPFS
ncbi:unnamed protein product [Danaus chrysippus]|uniref:(African queen) hypothetical protein n=1 Tax=Danaus chrysippus TaxID=151541 RepID=A0A8J2QKZ0_9NEOP|nr:unnamed protein product [Danaus chrysippus]